MSREAMKMAIEALEDANDVARMEFSDEDYYSEVINALRQAIEQSEQQEPVAWIPCAFDEIADANAKIGPWLSAALEDDICDEFREAIEWWFSSGSDRIRELPQHEWVGQEPVLWLKTWSDGSVSVLKTKSQAFVDRELEPLYTTPPKKEWVGLTDDEVSDVIDDVLEGGGWLDVARALESAIKEKNT